MKALKIILLLVYIFSPIDLLPEALLGPLGLIDDGAAVLLILKNIFEDKDKNKDKNINQNINQK